MPTLFHRTRATSGRAVDLQPNQQAVVQGEATTTSERSVAFTLDTAALLEIFPAFFPGVDEALVFEDFAGLQATFSATGENWFSAPVSTRTATIAVTWLPADRQ